MTHFICISGQARHGKDTTAAFIKEELSSRGYSVLVIHYADLLKFICKTFFGWNGEKDEAGRTMLQHIGTDCIRAQNPNYWVDFVANIVRMFSNQWDYVIVPDTRFPNEIERLSDEGFSVTHVRVVREGFDSQLTDEQKNHKSETALNDTQADFWINNTTLKELQRQAELLCDYILAKRRGKAYI